MVGHNDSVVGRASNNLATQVTSEAITTSASLESVKFPDTMSHVSDGAPARVNEGGDLDITTNNLILDNNLNISAFHDIEQPSHQIPSALPGDEREVNLENQASASASSASSEVGQTIANVVENIEDFSILSGGPPMDLVSDFPDEVSTTDTDNTGVILNTGAFGLGLDASSDVAAPDFDGNSDIGSQNDDMNINDDYLLDDLDYVDGFDAEPDGAAFNAHDWHVDLQALRDNGCLIDHIDLISFANDGLEQERPYSFVYPECFDLRDTKKFYVSNDEFFLDDSHEFDETQRDHPRPTNAHASNGPSFTLGQESTLLNDDYPPSFDVVYAQHNDEEVGGEFNNQGGMSVHTESMKLHCLNPSSAASSTSTAMQQQKQKLKQKILGYRPRPFGRARLTLHPHELVSSFAAFYSSFQESRVYDVLMTASRMGSGYTICIVHQDIAVNQPILTFLSGLRPVHGSPSDVAKYKKYVARYISGDHFGQNEALSYITRRLALEASQDKSTAGTRPPRALHPLLNLDEYYAMNQRAETSAYYIHPSLVVRKFQEHIASSILATPLAPFASQPYIDANGNIRTAFEQNLTIDQFIRQWYMRSRVDVIQTPSLKGLLIPISGEAAHVLDWERPEKISRPDSSRMYDIQAIPWESKLQVRRSAARALRDRMYTSYHNMNHAADEFAKTLPKKEDYFRPKTMYTKYKASMNHFQLRNLMSVTASNTIQYAHKSKIYSATPYFGQQTCMINLSIPGPESALFDAVKISTMKAKHGVTVLGGFNGEYAYRGEVNDNKVVDGLVTGNHNGITNHIDIVQNRTNYSPHAIISSNDGRTRVLDCATNTFIAEQTFARAVNCTDTSPDGRLRIIIGDSPDAWIIDSDTGKPVHALLGHRDFGFACAWSPDMRHVATGNQDRTVRIWDARMWRCLQTIDSDIAGYRSLRFSPVGGGPRTLLMCEPADRIVLVNAQTFETRQVHNFFGEIGGADFSPDGSRIWVANMDAKFGGLMEFDRNEWGQEYGVSHTRKMTIESRGDVFHPDKPNEWLFEDELDDDDRCVLGAGERKVRFQKLFNGVQYEMLNPLLG